jgi:hypothetical protein
VCGVSSAVRFVETDDVFSEQVVLHEFGAVPASSKGAGRIGDHEFEKWMVGSRVNDFACVRLVSVKGAFKLISEDGILVLRGHGKGGGDFGGMRRGGWFLVIFEGDR